MPVIKKYFLFIVITLLVAITLLVSSTDFSKSRPDSFVDQMLLATIAPIQKVVVNITGSISDLFKKYLLLVNTYEHNKKLQSELQKHILRTTLFQEVSRENNRLRKLLQMQPRIVHSMIPAKIIGNNPSSSLNILRIDKGTSHKISIGMPVVTSGGAVGYIYRATESYSDVLLITNPGSSISAIIQRNRVRGTIEGTGSSNILRLKYVHHKEEVMLGDRVITSNFGETGLFPQGYTIGTVIKLDLSSDSVTKSIFLRPNVDFSTIEEVFVLLRVNPYLARMQKDLSNDQPKGP